MRPANTTKQNTAMTSVRVVSPSNRSPVELDLKRTTTTLLLRAARLRCPQCGRGRMFEKWVKQLPRCSNCGLKFDRGEHDSFIGAYTVNLIVAELAVVGGMLVGMYLTWPNVPWTTIKWVLLPLAILVPLLTYPFSKALWLAIDLIYQPAGAKDFDPAA